MEAAFIQMLFSILKALSFTKEINLKTSCNAALFALVNKRQSNIKDIYLSLIMFHMLIYFKLCAFSPGKH